MNLATGTEAITVGTVVAGRYRVIEVLGRGGMGVVYRVEHAHTGEELALKVLLGTARFDPQAVSRFKREARATARIRSEHVVRVTDADTAPELGDMPFIVMEMLHGSDFERYVSEHGPMEPETLVAALTQVGRALEIAHGLGIVHRDLKPENLFLHRAPNASPIAKVLDFGISKFVTGEAFIETANMTSTGSVLGTPLYMAPEQAHGLNDAIAPSTDIWAMGLVAMRLLTGESYWGMPTMADLMMKLVVKPMIPPSERWPAGKHMSPALDAWFAKSCAREQGERFASVEQQMRELTLALGVEPSVASGATALTSLVPPAPTPSGSIEDAALAATAPLDSGPPAATPKATVPHPSSFVEAATVAITGDEQLALSRSRTTKPPGRTTRFAAFGALAALAIGGGVYASVRAGAVPAAPVQIRATADALPPPAPVTLVETAAPVVSASASTSAPVVDAGEPPPRPVPVAVPQRPAVSPRRPLASASAAPSAAPASTLFAPQAP